MGPSEQSRAPRSYKRRSPRIKLKIPLTIVVTGATLEAETVTVSKYGAKIRIVGGRGKLACGENLHVSVRTSRHQQQLARVVWLDKSSEPQCGIELDHPSNFWAAYFPGKDAADWRSRPEDMVAASAAVAAPMTEREAMAATAPAALPIEDVEPDAVHTPASAIVDAAVVTGLSAIRTPLSETVPIQFHRPDEATVLLRTLVEPGTRLRLILGDNRSVMGRVAGVASRKHAGKWRVRIKCDSPCC